MHRVQQWDQLTPKNSTIFLPITTVVAKSLRSPLNFEDFHFYLIYGSNQKQKSFLRMFFYVKLFSERFWGCLCEVLFELLEGFKSLAMGQKAGKTGTNLDSRTGRTISTYHCWSCWCVTIHCNSVDVEKWKALMPVVRDLGSQLWLPLESGTNFVFKIKKSQKPLQASFKLNFLKAI